MTKRYGLALVVLSAALVSVGASARAASVPSTRVPVKVFFPRGSPGIRCDHVVARRRLVRPPAVLREAMSALLRGPSAAERARGYGGWFTARTAGKLRGVRILRGIAHVDFSDFRRVIPNASSSCGSALLLAQLDRTAHQFPSVRQAIYSFNGSRRAFYEWLQRAAPTS